MMWKLFLKLLKPFPCVIKGLTLRLEKGCDIILKLGCLPGWKVFTKETLERASQVVKEFALELRSSDFALSSK